MKVCVCSVKDCCEHYKTLQQENKQLKDNWNELKKFIEDYKEISNWCDKELLLSFNKQEVKCCQRILDKIKELEEGVK